MSEIESFEVDFRREKHDEDCPCFGDVVEHSKDCKNCTCETNSEDIDSQDLAEVEIYKLFRKWRAAQNRPRVTDAWRAGYEENAKRVQELEKALQSLISGFSACHYCGAELIPERGAAHCEDCPAGCESHDPPDCTQLYELIEQARTALRK